MPSATRMYARLRRSVALAVVLTTGVVAPATAAAGAPTTTSSTTTTTPSPAPTTTTTMLTPSQVPALPPFSLPLDYGLKLLAQRAAASKELLSHAAALPGHRAAAQAAQARWTVLQRRLEKLEARVR